MKQCYCKTCNRSMVETQFYKSNNIEKYPPDGRFSQCKKCLTLHVDNFDPDTYLWILQEADVPYVPEEWNKLLMGYGKDRSKLTSTSIIGRYLAKMKLKQYRDFRWKDTEFLKQMAAIKLEQTMKSQGYDNQEIASAVEKQSFVVPVGELYPPAPPEEEEEDYFDRDNEDNFDQDLTEEDRTYLRLKWGKTYKPEEWVRLEQLYAEMMNSYDIQSAGHIDTLKLICKTSLKANQLLDLGDVDGAQKMIKMYDGLMKSGKFNLWTMKNFSSYRWGLLKLIG